MEPTPTNPDEATRRDQVGRFLRLLDAAAFGFGVAELAAGLQLGSPRAFIAGALWVAFGAWLVLVLRRTLARRPVSWVVARVAVIMIGITAVGTLLQPSAAYAAAMAVLIPVALALPYLELRSLRLLIVLAWVATVGIGVARFLPDDIALPPVVLDLLSLWGLALASGVLLFFLLQSSERLKASTREFSRLFQLSSDLAETTEPAVLGEVVARHLAAATGFDDCVIHALAPDTGRLAPFGSYPTERSLEAELSLLADRPMLGRVIHDRVPIVIDAADGDADPTELRHLRAAGRGVMLLVPLVARSQPVGVAELTASGRRPLDERRLALARTLAFEAAMAIENGRLYQELHHRALHDSLTGLAGRNLFHDRVGHALTRLTRQEGAIVAALFIDLDRFKEVNDTLGHARGDRLLVLVAERLRAVVRPADTVARLGGDEFALLLEDVASGDEALAVGERVVAALAVPFALADRTVTISVSVGVAIRSVAGATVDELVQEADAAMYEAKRTGKGRAVHFQPGLRGGSDTTE